MSDETRWDAIRRRLNESNCWPSGPVFELLDELEAEAELLCDEGELMKALEELGEATVRIEKLEREEVRLRRLVLSAEAKMLTLACNANLHACALRKALEDKR